MVLLIIVDICFICKIGIMNKNYLLRLELIVTEMKSADKTLKERG